VLKEFYGDPFFTPSCNADLLNTTQVSVDRASLCAIVIGVGWATLMSISRNGSSDPNPCVVDFS
jgi:hypothetical protein